MIRLSVLDQSTVVSGRIAGHLDPRKPGAGRRIARRWATHRYWVAEHHNSDSQAGTAPEILISAIAATTQRIRVGSAGVMLPHYSSLKVAEQFRVLEAIAPGRIDLGLGRAPGSDGLTAFALNPAADTAADHFPAQVRDLLAWLAGEPLVEGHPFRDVRAQPQRADGAGGLDPRQLRLWRAGRGAFRPAVLLRRISSPTASGAAEALALYREGYRPSVRHPRPHGAVCVWAVAGRPRRRRSGCSPRARCGGWGATAGCSCRCPRRRRPHAIASPTASARGVERLKARAIWGTAARVGGAVAGAGGGARGRRNRHPDHGARPGGAPAVLHAAGGGIRPSGGSAGRGRRLIRRPARAGSGMPGRRPARRRSPAG